MSDAIPRETRIPFTFVPIPWTMFTALRRGELTVAEFRVLVALYARWTPGHDLTVRVRDLDSLAESVRWELKTDTLSKSLRSLRTGGWIAYESHPGRTRHAYDIELRPDRSEHDPSRSISNEAGSGDSADTADPSKGAVDPSDEGAGSPLSAGDRAAAEPEPVRASKDVSRRTTSQSEEDVGPARAREETGEEELDRLWRESALPSKGAYSEPNG